MKACPLCGKLTAPEVLAEAGWAAPEVVAALERHHPGWQRFDGACPACVQQALLVTLLRQGEEALHEGVQSVWPLDAEAAFGALPTPLRMHADPRYTGKGVTIAFVDSGFYPHPDLVQPANRIRAWVDASEVAIRTQFFEPDADPRWPGWADRAGYQWHGMMTSTVATGNGWLSHGLYRGLASDSELVLIQVKGPQGQIDNESILRGLRWILQNESALGIKVVNLSLGGDPVSGLARNPVDDAVADLVLRGLTVVVAAGNDGQRRLVPPATAPDALTVGGIDDQNMFDHRELQLWHSNYGEGDDGALKPELVAPSIWVVAPIIPGTDAASEASDLFRQRATGEAGVEALIKERQLVTPHYKHVDGTSFAAPLTTSVIACMLEANPALTPTRVRELLRVCARPVAGAPTERQGAGALEAGQSVAFALSDQHEPQITPQITKQGIIYLLHDHHAARVEIFGSWNGWKTPGLVAAQTEKGLWKTDQPPLYSGRYTYKFFLDGERWMDDPANPRKSPDGFGRFNSVLVVP